MKDTVFLSKEYRLRPIPPRYAFGRLLRGGYWKWLSGMTGKGRGLEAFAFKNHQQPQRKWLSRLEALINMQNEMILRIVKRLGLDTKVCRLEQGTCFIKIQA